MSPRFPTEGSDNAHVVTWLATALSQKPPEKSRVWSTFPIEGHKNSIAELPTGQGGRRGCRRGCCCFFLGEVRRTECGEVIYPIGTKYLISNVFREVAFRRSTQILIPVRIRRLLLPIGDDEITGRV